VGSVAALHDRVAVVGPVGTTESTAFAGHVGGVAQPPWVPEHTPFVQTSPVVHGLPSSQCVPLVATGFEHTPLDGSHVPARWHWSLAWQTTELPWVHEPPTHVYG
jgi:hypothetical protein